MIDGTLRMPLHSENKVIGVRSFQRFHNSILGAASHSPQAGAHCTG